MLAPRVSASTPPRSQFSTGLFSKHALMVFWHFCAKPLPQGSRFKGNGGRRESGDHTTRRAGWPTHLTVLLAVGGVARSGRGASAVALRTSAFAAIATARQVGATRRASFLAPAWPTAKIPRRFFRLSRCPHSKSHAANGIFFMRHHTRACAELEGEQIGAGGWLCFGRLDSRRGGGGRISFF